MPWLPILICILFTKTFTHKNKGLRGENLLSLLKIAASVKESGLMEILKSEQPLTALFSGDFPLEKLMGLLSVFSGEQQKCEEEQKKSSPFCEELSGEEMSAVLRDMLDEKGLAND